MQNSSKDIIVAFGAVMTIVTVWSFIDMAKCKKEARREHEDLHKKLDAIMQKLGPQA